MAEIEFLDIHIGDGLRLNGYAMGLLAVGNLLIADHERVEIVILQKLGEAEEAQTPQGYLIELLKNSGFANGVLQDIIAASIGRRMTNTNQLNADELQRAILAVEQAIADDEQLENDEV
jgi:hypothetical protein